MQFLSSLLKYGDDTKDTGVKLFVLLLEKWFPLQGERAHSLNFVVCMYVNRINLPKSI